VGGLQVKYWFVLLRQAILLLPFSFLSSLRTFNCSSPKLCPPFCFWESHIFFSFCVLQGKKTMEKGKGERNLNVMIKVKLLFGLRG